MEKEHKIVMENQTAELGNLSLYDMNKSLLQQTNPNPLSVTKVREKENEIKLWIIDNVKKFLMLYNKEFGDFTILQLDKSDKNSCQYAVEQAIDILTADRGYSLISIEKCEGEEAWEIWIRRGEDYTVYYLFPYDNAVIYCSTNWLNDRGYMRGNK